MRLEGQVSALVGDGLDLLRCVAQQLVSKIGEGPCCRDLLPDLRDLLVIGVTTSKAVASRAEAANGKPCLGQCLSVILAKQDFYRPAIESGHGRSPSSGRVTTDVPGDPFHPPRCGDR